MKQPFVDSTADPEIWVGFQSQLAEARETPVLSHLVSRPTADLYPRYSGYYRQLCQLPRRVRRQLQRQWRRSLSAIALLLALGQAPALAATINVDGTTCTLVDAITSANTDAPAGGCAAGNGADTIVLPTGSTQSLTAVDNDTFGPTGLPLITSTVTIQGRNSTIRRESSAPEFRILAVSTGDLTLHSTTVSGGNSASSGGGVVNGYLGILTLINTTVSGNSAGDRGGGVDNDGTLTLTNSTVSGNSAGEYGGGVSSSGYNCDDCIVTLTNSTVSGNSAGRSGGGMSNYDGIVTLTNTTVSGNHADSGGGVYNYGGLTLTNSTVSGNSADLGGGVSNYNGTLTLTNTTVSGNSAGSRGGGVNNSGTYAGGDATLTNSTVSGNSAGSSGGGVYSYGENNTLTLARTLVSGNTGPAGPEIQNIESTITADNDNLFGHDGDAGVFGFSPGPTDIVPSEGLDAILNTTLADNGGPTQSHALPVGSPALDASPDDADCAATDQRGVTRPQGAACDIGAFEKGPAVRCNGQIARIIGTVGNDSLLSGTPGPDVIHGLAGHDTINGLEGNDRICGGTGDDEIFGASGADALNGGGGTDTCNGGSGADTGVSCEMETSIP